MVPLALRPKVLKELHLPYIWISEMKSLVAHQSVWWSAIDEDFEKLDKTFDHCCHKGLNASSAPRHPCTIYTEKLWQRVYVDLAGPFLQKIWMVIVDANSKWPIAN